MRPAIAALLLLASCAAHPVTVVKMEPAPTPAPIIVVHRDVPPVVPQSEVNADLRDAQNHLAEADRYVAWDKSKPRIVDRLGPLANAVAAAAKKVEQDNARKRVGLRDDAELRAATAALQAYLATKGD
jgi:hypothetical protein